MSRVSRWAIVCAAGAAVLGCTAKGPSPDDLGQPKTSLSERDEIDEIDEIDAWRTAYLRGEIMEPSGDPTVFYMMAPDDPCRPMPQQRPAGFEVIMWHDPYEEDVEAFFGIAEHVCHLEWFAIVVGIRPPAGRCTVLESAQLDELHTQLRALEPWTITSKPLDPSPHSAGWGLVIKWPGSHCELLDVLGITEIEARDDERFRAALELVRARIRESATSADTSR